MPLTITAYAVIKTQKSRNTSVLKGKQQMVHIIPENGIEMPLTNEEKKIWKWFCLYSDKLTAPVEAFRGRLYKIQCKRQPNCKSNLKTSNYIERKHFSDYYRNTQHLVQTNKQNTQTQRHKKTLKKTAPY